MVQAPQCEHGQCNERPTVGYHHSRPLAGVAFMNIACRASVYVNGGSEVTDAVPLFYTL